MPARDDSLLIIDGDSHVLEPPGLWDEYLEPEFRPRAIRITRSVTDRDGEVRGVKPMLPTAAQAPADFEDLPEMALELSTNAVPPL